MFPGARDELMSADLRVMQGDISPGWRRPIRM